MKCLLFAVLIIAFSLTATAQKGSFPESWVGSWKGELQWFKAGKADPQKVNMELHIRPADSTGHFTWQIIYGKASEDNRPYLLKPKDVAAGHWVIDERNGIVLDQFWAGNKFSGAFTVQSNTIINSYSMENNQLMVEFYSIGAKPLATSGGGTEESPKVDSYKMNSYQKAVLKRAP
ncbi:MAG: hypothetical protein FJY20_08110 [Bacteroidetes bacterium]|nr:hypothetical protein [Bacteroidota bacterium]